MLSGDSTLVEDQGARRWLVLHRDHIVRTQAVAPEGKLISVGGADRHGRILDIQPFAFKRSPGIPYTPMMSNAESLLVLLRHRAKSDPRKRGTSSELTDRVDTVVVLRGRGSVQTVATRAIPPPASRWLLENPLDGEDQAILFDDGWIALAFRDPYHVEWITPMGVRVRGSPITISGAPLGEPLKEALIRWRWPRVSPPFSSKDLPPWPVKYPPFLGGAVLTNPDGRLVIRRTHDPRSSGTLYDFFDRTGKRVLILRMAAHERLVGVGANSLYVVRKDADDVEWLGQHSFPGS
jgi:hypothetical protein